MKKIYRNMLKLSIAKKIIIALVIILSSSANAQLDRSIMPESGPAPEIFFGKPQTFKLDNGLTVMVVENTKLPRASASLSFDNPLIFEGDIAGVSSILAEMVGNGTQSISKEDFIEEIDYMGASLNVTGSGAFAGSLKRYFPRVLELMASAVLEPLFTQEEFDRQKNLIKESLKTGEKDVGTAADRVESFITYGSQHPNGEFISQESLDKASLQDAIDFYNNYSSPSNAYLVIIGDVNYDEIKSKVTNLFGSWSSKDVSASSFPSPTNPDETEIIFVDMPNGVQSVVSIINTVDFNKNNSDYFAALVANRILGGGGAGRLFNNLREDKGWTYGSYSGISESYKTKGTVIAQAQVRNEVTDSAALELLIELDKMKNSFVTDEELNSAKAKYTGNFVLSLENPSTIAGFARNIITQDLPEDYYNSFLENINSVTKEDVQNAAKNYFLTDNTRVFITGKGSEILESIENIEYNGKKLKVRYFDKYANEIERPNYTVDSNISAEDVIDNYLKAIGGKDALSEVTSIEIKATSNIQGTVLEMYSVKNDQNQSLMEMSAMGMTIAKTVFNKYQGFNEVNGQRVPLTEIELEQAIINSALFSELNFDFSIVQLVGTSEVEGEEAYEIKVTDNKSVFYSVDTGLKLKEVESQEVEGNLIVGETYFKEYEEVEGILLPKLINQVSAAIPIPGGITFKATSIKLNVETNESDFN
ncbi:MAG: M16 family metallopeptidase [Candidatus Marisimplicoccus sp.]|jgi:zinc protease|tara:strand:+ start:2213 stop:4324 length:2112 start_codon:yes stop_codon:yes gene_type:complete